MFYEHAFVTKKSTMICDDESESENVTRRLLRLRG
jgi:hypothetical protein